MSLLALCTHAQLKDVVFDIVDVRDAMPLRLVSKTIRAAVEDFGLQVFAEGIEEENRTMTAKFEKHLTAEKEDHESPQSDEVVPLFASHHQPWYRMFTLIAKANDWVLHRELLDVVHRSQCLCDWPGRWESELMYRCRGKGVSFFHGGIEHLPPGPEGRKLLQELLADLKYVWFRPYTDLELTAFMLSCMTNLVVADLCYAVLDDTCLEALVATKSLRVLIVYNCDDSNAKIRITSAGLKRFLDRCDNLDSVELDTELTPDTIGNLTRIVPRLRSLKIKIRGYYDLDFQPLAAACGNLRSTSFHLQWKTEGLDSYLISLHPHRSPSFTTPWLTMT